MLAPAFNDEIFEPIFGVTYAKLSVKQGDGLWRSMHTCNSRGFSQTIRGAVTPHKEYYNNKKIWTRAIEEASKTPFNITVKNRKEYIANLKSRMKIASKRRREATFRRQEQRNKKFTALMETIGKINERAFPDETRDEANNYADYGACAEKLQSRLAHCFVGPGSCDNAGNCSTNSTHCDKGIFGTQCIETIKASAKRHISYYCDIQNSRAYNENRKVVIEQICSGK